jgi:hypothetical protein
VVRQFERVIFLGHDHLIRASVSREMIVGMAGARDSWE